MLSAIESSLGAYHLEIMGAFHPDDEDLAPAGTRTIVLLGPKEPGFWAYFSAEPEYRDGAKDPLDRWSRRAITAIGAQLDAVAVFPFGGPPYQPFIRWALRSGSAWQSPAGPLVHARAGMMVSYRGALAFSEELAVPASPPCPCTDCLDQPCTSTCPVNALTGMYDVAACHAHLETAAGQSCMQGGCAARLSCPVSRSYDRKREQSAFHMKAFHP